MVKVDSLYIFDLDHTVAKGNVSFAFGHYLFKLRRFSCIRCLALILSYFFHKIGLFSVARLHEICFSLLFKDKSSAQIQEDVEKFLKENSDSLFRPKLLQTLKMRQAQGSSLWLLSTSPEILVKPISEFLGFSHYHSTQYETDSQFIFNRIISVFDGKEKAVHLKKFLAENPGEWDITVYTDSHLDIDLLECATNPIVVCPTKKLRSIAQRRGWQILDI